MTWISGSDRCLRIQARAYCPIAAADARETGGRIAFVENAAY